MSSESGVEDGVGEASRRHFQVCTVILSTPPPRIRHGGDLNMQFLPLDDPSFMEFTVWV